MLEIFLQPAFWAGVVLLIGMELVLSTDNMRFMSAMTAQLPQDHRDKIVRMGMIVSAAIRLVVLFAVVWVLGLERTAFSLLGWSPSWREVVLIAGGLFLVYKAATELQALVEPSGAEPAEIMPVSDSLSVGIAQIVLVNAVLSVDAIVIAIGLSPYVEAMAIALVASLAILYVAGERVAAFVAANPSIRALTLAVLLTVGIVLVADGLGMEIWRPYLYAAIGFAVLVLLVSKLVRSFMGREGIDGAPATAGAYAASWQEPRLDPAPETPASVTLPDDLTSGGSLEPKIMEPVEPVFDDVDITPVRSYVDLSDAGIDTAQETAEISADMSEAAAEPEPDLEPAVIAQDTIVAVEPEPVADLERPLDAEPEVFVVEESDSESLGAADEPVQKSRSKRASPLRRAERLRTGRRKE